MILCTQTANPGRRIGLPETIRMYARVGYDAYDISIFDVSENNPLYRDGWREYAAELKRIGDEAGIRCTQAHAPFPSYAVEDEKHADYNAHIFDWIVRSMEAAALLGARDIVVHPIQNVPYWDNVEYLFEKNMDFYRSLAPYAKKFGIRVALENMWKTRDGQIVDSTCATPEEFCRYLDTLADDCFTGCLDLGHCGLCGHDAAEMIRTMGAEHIGALHIHDNDFLHDSHTMPYVGKMDWESIMQALADIRFAGSFTYEADSFLSRFPTEYLEDAVTFMQRIGRRMADRIEEKMKENAHRPE